MTDESLVVENARLKAEVEALRRRMPATAKLEGRTEFANLIATSLIDHAENAFRMGDPTDAACIAFDVYDDLARHGVHFPSTLEKKP